jgi:hypothetical protein
MRLSGKKKLTKRRDKPSGRLDRGGIAAVRLEKAVRRGACSHVAQTQFPRHAA